MTQDNYEGFGDGFWNPLKIFLKQNNVLRKMDIVCSRYRLCLECLPICKGFLDRPKRKPPALWKCSSEAVRYKIMPFAATWMDLENVIMSEVSQTQKDKYHTISLICGI